MDSSDRLIKYIAFLSIRTGKGQVIILNSENNSEYPLPIREAVFSLAVSPDGRQIAISTAQVPTERNSVT